MQGQWFVGLTTRRELRTLRHGSEASDEPGGSSRTASRENGMKRMMILAMLLLPCGGCGGYYILSVPDQLGRTDGNVVPVARLQRNDFFVLALSQSGAPLRFRIDDGVLRASSTDKLGYAAVDMPLPEEPGRYPLYVSMQDPTGEEMHQTVPVYVWDSATPVVAVEFDALPTAFSPESGQAAQALATLAETNKILYLTRQERPNQEIAHEHLLDEGFPDGPVLLWQRERWHIVREGKLKIPRIEVESRLVSQLPSLINEFPRFRVGICRSELAAKAFADAGLDVIVIGNPNVQGRTILHRTGWADLAEEGIPEFLQPPVAPAMPSP